MSKPESHTPGPWHIGGTCIHAPTGIAGVRTNGESIPELPKIVAQIIRGHGITDEQFTANAHLIAAAPEILAALKDLVGAIDGGRITPDETIATRRYIDTARAAIAKAEGRQ
jgi:hypothetical protein